MTQAPPSTPAALHSPDAVTQALATQGYISSRSISTA
ncbi:MAG: hypothetical protein RLZ51_664, partial [Pseudomonadota bacterium]